MDGWSAPQKLYYSNTLAAVKAFCCIVLASVGLNHCPTR